MIPTGYGVPAVAIRVISDTSGYVHDIGKLTTVTKRAGASIQMALATAAAGVVGLLTASMRVGAQFETQMKLTGLVANATGAEMTQLEFLARKLGRTTQFSAAQAAEAMYSFASAGFTANQMMRAITHTLELAGAQNYDLAGTSEMVVSALKMFGMQTTQTQRIVDAYTVGVQRSLLTMEKLRYAMSYAGPVAYGFGMSIEETVYALEQFSNIGLEGSRIGVGFRMMMKEATKSTYEKVKALQKYNMTMKDINPATEKFIGIIKKVAEVNMTVNDALKVFGARTGAYVVAIAGFYKRGLMSVEKDMQFFQDSIGKTTKQYQEMMTTWQNQWQKTKNVIGDVMISIFKKFSGPAINGLERLQNSFRFLSKEIEINGGFVRDLADFFDKLCKWMGVVVKNARLVGQAFEYLVKAAAPFVTMMYTFRALTLLQTGFAALAASAGTTAIAFSGMGKTITSTGARFLSFEKTVSKGVSSGFAKVGNSINSIIDVMLSALFVRGFVDSTRRVKVFKDELETLGKAGVATSTTMRSINFKIFTDQIRALTKEAGKFSKNFISDMALVASNVGMMFSGLPGKTKDAASLIGKGFSKGLITNAGLAAKSIDNFAKSTTASSVAMKALKAPMLMVTGLFYGLYLAIEKLLTTLFGGGLIAFLTNPWVILAGVIAVTVALIWDYLNKTAEEAVNLQRAWEKSLTDIREVAGDQIGLTKMSLMELEVAMKDMGWTMDHFAEHAADGLEGLPKRFTSVVDQILIQLERVRSVQLDLNITFNETGMSRKVLEQQIADMAQKMGRLDLSGVTSPMEQLELTTKFIDDELKLINSKSDIFATTIQEASGFVESTVAYLRLLPKYFEGMTYPTKDAENAALQKVIDAYKELFKAYRETNAASTVASAGMARALNTYRSTLDLVVERSQSELTGLQNFFDEDSMPFLDLFSDAKNKEITQKYQNLVADLGAIGNRAREAMAKADLTGVMDTKLVDDLNIQLDKALDAIKEFGTYWNAEKTRQEESLKMSLGGAKALELINEKHLEMTRNECEKEVAAEQKKFKEIIRQYSVNNKDVAILEAAQAALVNEIRKKYAEEFWAAYEKDLAKHNANRFTAEVEAIKKEALLKEHARQVGFVKAEFEQTAINNLLVGKAREYAEAIDKEYSKIGLSDSGDKLQDVENERIERLKFFSEELETLNANNIKNDKERLLIQQRIMETEAIAAGKRKDILTDRLQAEYDIQKKIMEMDHEITQSKIFELAEEVSKYEEAGIDRVLIEEYTQKKLKEIQEEASQQFRQYYKAMAEDMKSTLSDTFVLVWRDMGNDQAFKDLGQKLVDNLVKSFADIQVERISGWINKLLETDFAERWVDKLGLGGFADAFKESKTPPSLKVLDLQYQIQKNQYDTQQLILKAIEGPQANAGITSVLPSNVKLPPQIENIFKVIPQGLKKIQESNYKIGSEVRNAANVVTSSFDPEGIGFDVATAVKEGLDKLKNRPSMVPTGPNAGLVLEGSGNQFFQQLLADTRAIGGDLVKEQGRYWLELNRTVADTTVATSGLKEQTIAVETEFKDLGTSALDLQTKSKLIAAETADIETEYKQLKESASVLQYQSKSLTDSLNLDFGNLGRQLKSFAKNVPGSHILQTLYDNLGFDKLAGYVKKGFTSLFSADNMGPTWEAIKNIPEYLGLDKLKSAFSKLADVLQLDKIAGVFKKVAGFVGLDKEWENIKNMFSSFAGEMFSQATESKTPVEALNKANDTLSKSLAVQRSILAVAGGTDPTSTEGQAKQIVDVAKGAKNVYDKIFGKNQTKSITAQGEFADSSLDASFSADAFSNSLWNASESTSEFSSTLQSVFSGLSGGGAGGGVGKGGFSLGNGAGGFGLDNISSLKSTYDLATSVLSGYSASFGNAVGEVSAAAVTGAAEVGVMGGTAEVASSSLTSFAAGLSSAGTGAGVGGAIGGIVGSSVSQSRGKSSGAAVGGAVGGVMGGATAALMGAGPYGIIAAAVLAAISAAAPSLFGADPLLRKRQMRGRMFGEGVKSLTEGEYSSLGQMMGSAPSYLFSPKYLYASQHYLGENVPQSEISYGIQAAGGNLKTMYEDVGGLSPAIAGSLDLVNTQINAFTAQVKRDFPESAAATEELRVKMLGLFKADVLQQFSRGIISLQSLRDQLQELGLEDAETQTQMYEQSIGLLFNKTMPLGTVQLKKLYEGMQELRDDMDEAADATAGMEILTNALAQGLELSGDQLERFRDNTDNLAMLQNIDIYRQMGMDQIPLAAKNIEDFDEAIDEMRLSVDSTQISIEQFNYFIDALPESMDELRESLQRVSYAMKYLADIWTGLTDALKEGDIGAVVDSLNEYAGMITDVIELTTRLGAAFEYLGMTGVSTVFTNLNTAMGKFLAAIQIANTILMLIKLFSQLREAIWDIRDANHEAAGDMDAWTIKKQAWFDTWIKPLIDIGVLIRNNIGAMNQFDKIPDNWGDIWGAQQTAKWEDIWNIGEAKEVFLDIRDMFWSTGQFSSSTWTQMTSDMYTYLRSVKEGQGVLDAESLAIEAARYFDYMRQNWETLSTQFGGNDKVLELIAQAKDYYAEKLQELVDAAVEAWKEFSDAIQNQINIMDTDIVSLLARAGQLGAAQAFSLIGPPGVGAAGLADIQIQTTPGVAVSDEAADFIKWTQESIRLAALVGKAWQDAVEDTISGTPEEALAHWQELQDYLTQQMDAELAAIDAYYSEQERLIREKYELENENLQDQIDLLEEMKTRYEDFIKNADDLIKDVKSGGSEANAFNAARREVDSIQAQITTATTPEEKMDLYDSLIEAYGDLWSSGQNLYEDDWIAFARLQEEVISGVEEAKDNGSQFYETEIAALQALIDAVLDGQTYEEYTADNTAAMEAELELLYQARAEDKAELIQAYKDAMLTLAGVVEIETLTVAESIIQAFEDMFNNYIAWCAENGGETWWLSLMSTTLTDILNFVRDNWPDGNGDGEFKPGLYYEIPTTAGDWWNLPATEPVDTMADIQEVLLALAAEFTSRGMVGDGLTGASDYNNAMWMYDRLTAAMVGGLTTQADLEQLAAILDWINLQQEYIPSGGMYDDLWETLTDAILALVYVLEHPPEPPGPDPGVGYYGMPPNSDAWWLQADMDKITDEFDFMENLSALMMEAQQQGSPQALEFMAALQPWLAQLGNAMIGGIGPEDKALLDWFNALIYGPWADFIESSMPLSTMFADLTDVLNDMILAASAFPGVYGDVPIGTGVEWVKPAEEIVDTLADVKEVLQAMQTTFTNTGQTTLAANAAWVDNLMTTVLQGGLAENDLGALELIRAWITSQESYIPGDQMWADVLKTLNAAITYIGGGEPEEPPIDRTTLTADDFYNFTVRFPEVMQKYWDSIIGGLTSTDPAEGITGMVALVADMKAKADAEWARGNVAGADPYYKMYQKLGTDLIGALGVRSIEDLVAMDPEALKGLEASRMDDFEYALFFEKYIANISGTNASLMDEIHELTTYLGSGFFDALENAWGHAANVPGYATGGIIPKTGQYTMHEGEIYSPYTTGTYGFNSLADEVSNAILSKSRYISSQGTGETVFVFVPYQTSTQEQERIFQDVKQRMKRTSQNEQFIYDKAIIKTNRGV